VLEENSFLVARDHRRAAADFRLASIDEISHYRAAIHQQSPVGTRAWDCSIDRHVQLQRFLATRTCGAKLCAPACRIIHQPTPFGHGHGHVPSWLPVFYSECAMLRSLLSIAIFIAVISSVNAQEHTWLCSAGGGFSIPVAPGDFTYQYVRGSTFSFDVSYELPESYALGASLHRDEFEHTGKRIHALEDDDRCISGGERTYTMLDAMARYYMPIGPNARWYVTAEAGVVWNKIADVTYVTGTMYEYTVQGIKMMNLTGAVRVGAMCWLGRWFGFSIETGYGIVEDGFVANQFVPLSVAATFRI
jgi:hypothetical protein